MGVVGGAGSAILAEIRITAEAVPSMFDVSALGGGGILSNNDLAGVMMIQCSLNQCLTLFVEQGTLAVRKEMQKIRDSRVLRLKDPNKMNRKEKAGSLKYLMFLEQKKTDR